MKFFLFFSGSLEVSNTDSIEKTVFDFLAQTRIGYG